VPTPAHASPAAPRTGQSEIRALTGLRIIAAGWVVLVHFGAFLAPYTDQFVFVRAVLGAGWIGVELFFILSGFLLTRGYLDECGRRPTPRTVGRFLFNRFARVWPAWALVTVLMGGWLFLVRASGRTADVYTVHPEVTVEAIARQLSMTQMWGMPNMVGASFVAPGWSISAEWTAYLAFPVLAVLLRPLRHLHPVVNLGLAHAAVVPLALVAYRTGPMDADSSWVLRIACGFLAGVFVALALRDVRPSARTESIGLALSVASIFLLVMLCFWATWRRGGELADYSQVAVLAFPGLIAGLALTTRGPARLLATPALVYGGRISYCLYLTHYLLLDVMCTVLWQDPAQRWVMTPAITLGMPFLLLATLPVSAALYHLVEEPARRALVGLLRPAQRPAAKGPVRVGASVHVLPVVPRTGLHTVAAPGDPSRPQAPRTSVSAAVPSVPHPRRAVPVESQTDWLPAQVGT
jgi:peptidoglycan/LPS O-acetylase OafA/YrhL